MNYKETISKLTELLAKEHVDGCGQNTCAINIAYEEGYTLWAIQLFHGCGASSGEFDKLYAELPGKFQAEAEDERQSLVANVSHIDCFCNAVIWKPEEVSYSCDDCGKVLSDYHYVEDLNERGMYRARVVNPADETVYTITNENDEGVVSEIEDGFMSDIEDMDGLKSHLIDVGVLPKYATIKKSR
jgi:hypothetical protein